MRIIVDSTAELAVVNGVPVRIWHGKSAKGTPIIALITRVGVAGGDDPSELERELAEPPTTVLDLDQAPAPPVPPEASPHAGEPHYEAARHAIGLLSRVSHAMTFCDGVPLDLADPYHRAVHAIGAIFTGAPDVRPPPPPPPSWLVKDFWILYQSAKALADACNGRGDGRPHPPLVALEGQLERLATAFETCDVERRMGVPDRLTPAERYALAALHRWLHSPSGDCDLIEAAQAFHEQAARESPARCDELDAEEREARSGELGARSDELLATAQRVFDRAGTPKRALTPECPAFGHDEPEPPPPTPLSGVIVRTILDDPRVGATDADPDAAALFMAHALRGAQMGWHARTSHPESEWQDIREAAAPDEPKRTAWLFGFDVAISAVAPTLTEEGVELPEPPVVLTDALRDYARRDLAYRAPEQLRPRDRAILAAIDAEETARAADPDGAVGATGPTGGGGGTGATGAAGVAGPLAEGGGS